MHSGGSHPNPGTDDDDFGHEQLLEALVTRLLTGEPLAQLCADADLPVLVDDTGEPVTVTASTYPDAGVLTSTAASCWSCPTAAPSA